MEKLIIDMLSEHGILSTWLIGLRIKEPSWKIRKELRRLEKEGKVAVHKFSSRNNLVWTLC